MIKTIDGPFRCYAIKALSVFKSIKWSKAKTSFFEPSAKAREQYVPKGLGKEPDIPKCARRRMNKYL